MIWFRLNNGVQILKVQSSLRKFQFIRNGCSLKEILEEKILEHQAAVKEFRLKHGAEVISQVQVNHLYAGMRTVKAFIWETSELSPEEGIRYRGYSIPELEKKLPTACDGDQPLPEAAFWLLLTGDIPTKDQADELTCEFRRRSKIPKYVRSMIRRFPKKMHPMTQLSCALGAMNGESIFYKQLHAGLKKTEYWDPTYEDALNVVAKTSILGAMIYNHTYRDCDDGEADYEDFTQHFSHLIGFHDKEFIDMMRLYFTIHADHEGGNVSAHTTHLVSSALSDSYISWAAGINGLAGPLHGLANQQVLIFIMKLKKQLGKKPSDEDVKKFVVDYLNSGRVVPGYGHAVLRQTDPRYTAQRKFALKHLKDDPLFKLVAQLFKIVPDVLKGLGKVANPWPNVDAHSGVLLYYYGLKEMHFYTVLFAISRTMGVMASNVWSRALGMPIERPKTLTTASLMKTYNFKAGQAPAAAAEQPQKAKA